MPQSVGADAALSGPSIDEPALPGTASDLLAPTVDITTPSVPDAALAGGAAPDAEVKVPDASLPGVSVPDMTSVSAPEGPAVDVSAASVDVKLPEASVTAPSADAPSASASLPGVSGAVAGASGAIAGASGKLSGASGSIDTDAPKKKSRFGLPSFMSPSGRKGKKDAGAAGALRLSCAHCNG